MLMRAICYKYKARCLSLILYFVLTIASFGITKPALGQESGPEVKVFDIRQQDFNQDGRPDQTSIECAFITQRDLVVVYDRGGDMERSDDWRVATDFHNDLWVFDAAADGQIELIVDFRESEQGLEAWLWDDQNGDGTVSFKPYPNLEVSETPGPAVKVIAPDGWWARDGKTNFNVDLVVDGKIRASFSSNSILKNLDTDGSPDFLIQVRDFDEDGRPDYQWTDVWPEAPSGMATRRTELVFSPNDDELPIQGAIFWPFLGSTLDWDKIREDRQSRLPANLLYFIQERSGYTKDYNISMPPIQMAWDKALILYVGEFVASRSNDSNLFVYSIQRAQAGEVSPATFEAPFAFYDLAGDDDGHPELSVRFEQYLKRDLFPFRYQNPEPVQIIRYSWDQDDNHAWDYKLGLIGRHPIPDIVPLGDLNLQMIPPDILPGWVIDQTWDGATFVAIEGPEYKTSEGIYEWGPGGHWRDRYLTGLSDDRPTFRDLGELRIGQRGEYAFDLNRQPRLYFSPIDRKLHLLGAEGGVWRMGKEREILYANLGGDYLNQWTLQVNGTPFEGIYFASNFIIFWDSTGVQLTRTDYSPALFITSAPTDYEDWLALKEQLGTHQQDLIAWDFKSLAAQFGRPQFRLEGAVIRDFRLTDTGFRFVLDLPPDFRVTRDMGPTFSALEPGTYLVEFDGEFKIEPLTPPELSLAFRMPMAGTVTAGIPASVLAEVTNEGLVDAKDLVLVLEAQEKDGWIEVGRQRIDALSGVPTRTELNWTPPSAGKWVLRLDVRDPGEGSLTLVGARQTVEVSEAGATSVQLLRLPTGGGWQLFVLFIMLGAFFTTMVRLLQLVLRTGDNESGSIVEEGQ